MSEDTPNSTRRPARWSGGLRYSPVFKLLRSTWVRGKRGGWRLVEKEVTETDYCYLAQTEKPGFNRGARVTKPAFNT